MRKELLKEEGSRKKFRGIFSRIGKKVNYKGYLDETILLKNIIDVDTGRMVSDHSWFNYTKSFEKLKLVEGMTVEFEARVKEYKKGYVNNLYKINNSTIDYKLSYPTNVKQVSI
jgi:hypothetical protein